MKISEVIAWFKQREQWFQHEGQPWGAMAAQCKANREALEQHHKDMMGLVEDWKEKKQTLIAERWFTSAEAIGECADQLESLINPKD